MRVKQLREPLWPAEGNPEKTFRLLLRAHWADADPAGVVYFTHFLRYFELAEYEFYRRLDEILPRFFEQHKVWLPRAEVHCRYHHPLRWNEEAEVCVRVLRVTERSVTYAFALFRHPDGRLLAEGRVVAVCVDQDSFRPRPLPPPLAAFLRGWLE